MRGRFSIFWLFLPVLTTASALAQDVFVTPIPNVPFSGSIDVERSFVQRDGSIVNFKTIRGIGRDNEGRIYNETRELMPVSKTAAPRTLSIHLYDPQTRVSTMLYPQNKTFRSFTVNRPPATEPPALLDASSTGNSLPPSQFTKEEDLGTREMEGVPVHGVRETQTVPAGNSGNGQEIVVTDEYWYSDDLRINMVIKHRDPRAGSVTMTVSHIVRSEPDPSSFTIPDGYIQALSGQGAIR